MYIKTFEYKPLEVLVNPTSNELRDFTKEAIREFGPDDNPLRSVTDTEGNKYYWKAYGSIHLHVNGALEKLGITIVP